MAHQHLVEVLSPSKKPFEEDFIMISEFSEQEGPKPLLTIPKDAGGAFDKNSFAVRIMAVDYQTGTPGSFEETKDTQVVLSEGYDPTTKVYAFVYHFTLHDIHARGYVRPFCMAYLTTDERKILVHFEELLHEFSKVSEVLKHGNWPLFDQELSHRVTDLEHTRGELISTQQRVVDGEQKDAQLAYRMEQCESTLEEIRNILSVVQTLVGRNTELDAQVSRFEELFESHRLHRPASESNILSSQKQEEGEEGGQAMGRKRSSTSPPSPEQVLGDVMASAANPNSPPVYQPQVLDVLKAKRFDQKLRSFLGLCGVCSRMALGHLRRILTHFGRDHEGVSIESTEFHCLEPQSALLTIGRRIVLNFLNGIDRCCAHCEWPLASGATTWRVPAFYRSQSALTVSSWGEMSFKSCVEELSGLEDAACTPPLFQRDQFFDANEGSSVFCPPGRHTEDMRAPGSLEDMYSLPHSDQSTDDVPRIVTSATAGEAQPAAAVTLDSTSDTSMASQHHMSSRASQVSEERPLDESSLNHVPSSDNKVMGWLNSSTRDCAEQDAAALPPYQPATRGIPSPGNAALTMDMDDSIEGGHVYGVNNGLALLHVHDNASAPYDVLERQQPQASSPSHYKPSSLNTKKRVSSFYDDVEDEEMDPLIGLVPRYEPGVEGGDKNPTVGQSASTTAQTTATTTTTTTTTTTGATQHVYTPSGFEISTVMPRTPEMDTTSQNTLTFAHDRDLPSAQQISPIARSTTAMSGASSPAAAVHSTTNKKKLIPEQRPSPHQPESQSRTTSSSLLSKQEPFLSPLSNTCISSYSDDLCRLSDSSPGFGLLKFRDRYAFAGHLVYALLRGRPVVVLGKTQRDVVALVRTLSVFVPGHSSQHQVIEWHTEPINLSHLAKVKLIGLQKARGSVVPHSVKPYVSILDYDTSTLTTPPYKGNYVSNIVHRQKKWMDDRSYLAHVHSVFLQMGCKAFLYFHNFCLNISLSGRDRGSKKQPAAFPVPDRSAPSKASKNSFLMHLGVLECDRDIIEYFVEVVKMQQMDQFRHSNNMDGADYPAPIHLDHSKCNVYQSRRPAGRFT